MDVLQQPNFQLAKENLRIKFGDPVERKKKDQRDMWKIRATIDGDDNFIQTQIHKVVYHTHPTFPPDQREIQSTNGRAHFPLTMQVWGRFTIRARVYLRNGDLVELSGTLPRLRS